MEKGKLVDNSEKETLNNLEKVIAVRIIQEDAEAIYSLMKSEKDSILSMGIIPYYALFVQSCQEYMGEKYLSESEELRVKDIRNHIKTYGEKFGKSKKRLLSVDFKQNEQFMSQLKFDFMRDWNVHLNLGTYWTAERHIVGNTQLFADFLGIEDMFNTETGKRQYELGNQLGKFVSSVRDGLSKNINQPNVLRSNSSISIDYFHDLNTNKKNEFFIDSSSKELNLFLLHLICNMNFVKYVLRTLFVEGNTWVFRVEYIVTYYTFRALLSLRNYYENVNDGQVELADISNIINFGNEIFQSKFRNCMMHYGLENQEVLSLKYINKPFYGIIETCFDGMDYHSYLDHLRRLSDTIILFLEKRFDATNIELQHL